MLSDFKPSNYTHNSTVYFPLCLPFGTVFIQNTYKISVIFLSWREKEDRKHKSSVAGLLLLSLFYCFPSVSALCRQTSQKMLHKSVSDPRSNFE